MSDITANHVLTTAHQTIRTNKKKNNILHRRRRLNENRVTLKAKFDAAG